MAAELGEAIYRLKLDRANLVEGLKNAQAETVNASNKIQSDLNKVKNTSAKVSAKIGSLSSSLTAVGDAASAMGLGLGKVSPAMASVTAAAFGLVPALTAATASFTALAAAEAAALLPLLPLIAAIAAAAIAVNAVIEKLGAKQQAEEEVGLDKLKQKQKELLDVLKEKRIAEQKSVDTIRHQIAIVEGTVDKYEGLTPAVKKWTIELDKAKAVQEKINKLAEDAKSQRAEAAARIKDEREKLDALLGIVRVDPVMSFQEGLLRFQIAAVEARISREKKITEEREKQLKIAQDEKKDADRLIADRRKALGLDRLQGIIDEIKRKRELETSISSVFAGDQALKADAERALGLTKQTAFGRGAFGSIAGSALAKGSKGLVGSAKKSDEALSLKRLEKIVSRMEVALRDIAPGLS